MNQVNSIFSPRVFWNSISVKQRRIFVGTLIAMLFTSLFSIGYHHLDEHFQILEFSLLKDGKINSDQLPWEYQDKIRSSVQPYMASGVRNLLSFFGDKNPFHTTLFLRILSGGLTLFTLLSVYNYFRQEFTHALSKKYFFLFSFLLWYFFYIGVRFSSETWSASTLTLGFLLLMKYGNSIKAKYLVLAGLLFGASFLFRFQMGIILLFLGLWVLLIAKYSYKIYLFVLTGIAISLGIGVLCDYLFYEEWTFSAWNYLFQFVTTKEDKGFDTAPWYYYFTSFLGTGIPPISLLILLGVGYFSIKNWKSPITWMLVPFVLLHTFIPHKEMRFLFPLVYFMPYILLKFVEESWTTERSPKLQRATVILINIGLILNMLILGVNAFRPAATQVDLYQTIYDNYQEPTTLYYLEDDIYHPKNLNLEFSYYRPDELETVHISSTEEIPSNHQRTQLLFLQQSELEQIENKSNLTKIWSSFPDWILAIEMNNWQSRSRISYLYKVN